MAHEETQSEIESIFGLEASGTCKEKGKDQNLIKEKLMLLMLEKIENNLKCSEKQDISKKTQENKVFYLTLLTN